MKKSRVSLIFTLILCFLFAFASCGSGAATNDIVNVKLDGCYINFDQPAVISENRTLVPMRGIFEALGAKVEYDSETDMITASKAGINLTMKAGGKGCTVNGKNLEFDVPSKVLNGRTLVPVRAVSESFDCNVLWDDDSKTVLITTPEQERYTGFEIHFIDVGQADCALVISQGKTLLIDGGNAEDSNLVYTYLKNHGIEILNYVVCTHAHEDHAGGLSGALSYARAEKIYAPKTESSSKAYKNFKDKAAEQGVSITNPKPGDTFSLGESEVLFLGPVKENSEDLNNTSIMLKITYGNTSFMFTGDAETEEERDVINSGFNLKSDLLKVGHHGSDTSSSYVFLREVMPKYAIISVGTGNSYGHPQEKALSRLRDAGTTIYRTDMQGDIVVKSNGENLIFLTSKSLNNVVTNPTGNDGNEGIYCGNKKSKKFHKYTCTGLPSEENRVTFSSREQAVSAGYLPCRLCNP